MNNHKKLIGNVGVKNGEGLIDKELAKLAGLKDCGKDNDGDELFIGNIQEWEEYKRLDEMETKDLFDEKINQDFLESEREESEEE